MTDRQGVPSEDVDDERMTPRGERDTGERDTGGPDADGHRPGGRGAATGRDAGREGGATAEADRGDRPRREPGKQADPADGESGRDGAGTAGEGQDEGKGKDKGKEGKRGRSRWPLIVLALFVLIAAAGGGVWWYLTRNLESTDDAYTEGRAVSMAPKVAGFVVEMNVADNQFVRTGDLLLRIDRRDYVTARDQAKANLDLARAQLAAAELDLQIARVRYPAQLQQAEAQRDSARASQAQAQAEYRRQRSVDPRATTQTSVDTATAQLQSNTAAVAQANAQVQIAGLVQQSIQLAETTVQQRRAQVEQAEAQLAEAEVNLTYTEIRAPQDGRITRRNVERGAFVQAGQQVFFIVTPEVWITANFKEGQLDRMRPGQPVRISVDAYPSLDLRGHVDSIQMGSGARFSAFPAENATGNFVKIVRRVPVKIVIDSGLDPGIPLPLGLSVVPTVDLAPDAGRPADAGRTDGGRANGATARGTGGAANGGPGTAGTATTGTATTGTGTAGAGTEWTEGGRVPAARE
ncbi:HlyD family secretion protein [Roseomonas sp. NAR14]|uniref:HlyD family secretion protein n=1 Tax=Roseomonas acroporae TaxID=2937791 RepID=A0A9X1YBK2_9PROT|nr:HlyD family secretion protein [Roseomonas acroporae]MCK8786727.1 HlyD family secretion protein [Roseomonas acroporae]